jgi:hypothetical protein
MEAICSSEMSVDTQRTTRRYISEDGTLHNYVCENLKSNINILFLSFNFPLYESIVGQLVGILRCYVL